MFGRKSCFRGSFQTPLTGDYFELLPQFEPSGPDVRVRMRVYVSFAMSALSNEKVTLQGRFLNLIQRSSYPIFPLYGAALHRGVAS